MQIFASTRGTFLEPFDAENTTDDLVSFLQFEAHTLKETQVLRAIYQIVQHGGVIRVRRDVAGFYMHTDLPPRINPSEGASSDTGTSMHSAETTVSRRRDKLDPFPLLAASAKVETQEPEAGPAEHRHLFTAKEASVVGTEGTWLRCACGEWEFFARRGLASLAKKIPKEKLN
jgi:hypothetical protein